MTTPIVVITYPNTAQTSNSERELLWYVDVKDLTDDMKTDCTGLFDIRITRETKLVLLTLMQLQFMFIKYKSTAPFDKYTMQNHLLGISYGAMNMNFGAASICIRGGGVSVNMYTMKTFLSENGPTDKGCRRVLGGDHIYFGYKQLMRGESVSFQTKMGMTTLVSTNDTTYYPYVFLSNSRIMKLPFITIAKKHVKLRLNTITQPAGAAPVVAQMYLGRVATVQTLPRRELSMNDSSYELVQSDSQQATYKLIFQMSQNKSLYLGSSLIGEDVENHQEVSDKKAIGEPLLSSADVAADKIIGTPMDVGKKRPSEEEKEKEKEKKRVKVGDPVPPFVKQTV